MGGIGMGGVTEEWVPCGVFTFPFPEEQAIGNFEHWPRCLGHNLNSIL